EEDMRLYGARQEPANDAVIDSTTLLYEQRQKRNASHLNITTERSSKSRRIDNDEIPSTQVLTAMDWNSGASPIAAWLNQSAMPSITPIKDDPDATDKLLLAQEVEEMKMFRNVHVKAAPCPASTDGDLIMDKDFAVLRPGARIFYRNIKDKYPCIPTYLARRLADANLDRAERLQKLKGGLSVGGLPLLKQPSIVPSQLPIAPKSPTFSASHFSYTKPVTTGDVPDYSPKPAVSESRRRRRAPIACVNCRMQKTLEPEANKETITSYSIIEQSLSVIAPGILEDISDEERLLLQLGSVTDPHCGNIAGRLITHFGSYDASALQIRYDALIERLSMISWSENDVHNSIRFSTLISQFTNMIQTQALKQANDYWRTSQFDIIAAKMLDFGASESWSAEYCAQQWQALQWWRSYGICPQTHQIDANQFHIQALEQAYDYWGKSQFSIMARKVRTVPTQLGKTNH
ncbi:MAG: hypothetical protein Q9180_005753, partial [Flavoplaca navasiana]